MTKRLTSNSDQDLQCTVKDSLGQHSLEKQVTTEIKRLKGVKTKDGNLQCVKLTKLDWLDKAERKKASS